MLSRPHWGQTDPAVVRATVDYVLTGRSATGAPPEPEGAAHWSAYKANDTRWDDEKFALMWRLYEPFGQVDPAVWQRYATLLPERMNVVHTLGEAPKPVCALLQQLGFLLARFPQERGRFPLAELGRVLAIDPREMARAITVDRQVKPVDSPMLELIARAPDFPAQLEAAGAFAGLAAGSPITDFVLEAALATDAPAMVRAAVDWACAQPHQELRPLFQRLGWDACRHHLEQKAIDGGVPGRRALEILHELTDEPEAVHALAARIDTAPARGLLRRWARTEDLPLPPHAAALFAELEVDEDEAVQDEALQVVDRGMADGDIAAGLRARHPAVRQAAAWWLAETQGDPAAFDAALAVETDGPTRQALVHSQLEHGRPSAAALRSLLTEQPATGPEPTWGDLPTVHWADTGEAVPVDMLRLGTQDPRVGRALGNNVPSAERDAFEAALMQWFLAVATDPRATEPVGARVLLGGFVGQQAVRVLHEFLDSVHATDDVSFNTWAALKEDWWEPVSELLPALAADPTGVQLLAWIRDTSLEQYLRDDAAATLENLAAERNCTVPQLLSRTLTPAGEDLLGTGTAALQEARWVGTRWDVASWTTELLNHPVQGPATRDLVWLAGPRKAALDAGEVAFRPSPDGTLLDLAGNPVTLQKSWVIWAAHTVLVPEDQALAWRSALEQAGVVPAQFPLPGAVHHLTEQESAAKKLSLGDGFVESGQFLAVCEELGWLQDRPGDPWQAEELTGYLRRFASVDVELAFGVDANGETPKWTRPEVFTLGELELSRAERFNRLSPVLQSVIAEHVARLRAVPRTDQ